MQLQFLIHNALTHNIRHRNLSLFHFRSY